jgi:hypothetical protein
MTRDGVERFRREMVADGALRGGLMWYRALPFTDRGVARRPVVVPTTMVWSDADDFIAPGEQAFAGVHADEAGTPGQEDLHRVGAVPNAIAGTSWRTAGVAKVVESSMIAAMPIF